jgi:hypothetical protein
MDNKLELFREKVLELAREVKSEAESTKTSYGSTTHFLFGEKISTQSVVIKFGNRFETLLNKFSTYLGVSSHFDGIKKIDGHQVDSLRLINNTLDYEEQKNNPGLDSEKAPATLKKITDIRDWLIKNYPQYNVRGCIFHTMAWEEKDAADFKVHYDRYKKNGIHVKTMKEYFESLNIPMTKEGYEDLTNEVRSIFNS